MAPSTRRNSRVTPPPNISDTRDANTIKKTRFYDAYDEHHEHKSMRAICAGEKITEGCGRKWIRQRQELGSAAYRHSRGRSTKLGRPSKVTKSMCKMLVDPTQNPIRNQPYDAQIAYHRIPVKRRQLQRKLKEHTNGGQKYKMAFVKKEISDKNKAERVEYGYEHRDKSVEDYWSYIFFSDEAHVDPTSLCAGEILRERGTRYNDENIQERGEKKGVRFHIAAWVTWFEKAEKLEFYHNEDDYITTLPMPPKPRRRPTTESEDEYQARLCDWEAQRPHKAEVKAGGNAMTQKYYAERLLPVYIEAIHKARLRDAGPWLFQEDGDPSHGMRKEGLAYQLKRENWITNLKHPAQSPDLNPIEAMWNIIKQRLRRKIFHSEEDIKQALQDEWSKITMTEVRKRITQMPGRCRRLTKNGGKPIKTALW